MKTDWETNRPKLIEMNGAILTLLHDVAALKTKDADILHSATRLRERIFKFAEDERRARMQQVDLKENLEALDVLMQEMERKTHEADSDIWDIVTDLEENLTKQFKRWRISFGLITASYFIIGGALAIMFKRFRVPRN